MSLCLLTSVVAYIGPGAGLGLIGALIAVVSAIMAAPVFRCAVADSHDAAEGEGHEPAIDAVRRSRRTGAVIGAAFDTVDAWLAPFSSDAVRIGGWAVLTGVASMAIYALTSPQRKLKALAATTAETQKALSACDGDFAVAWPLIRKLLSTAFARLGLTLAPSLAAGLPVILVLIWMDGRFGCAAPRPGETVAVNVLPSSATVVWQPQDAAQHAENDEWLVRWPEHTEKVHLRTADGADLFSIPNSFIPEITRPNWWHAVMGTVALPADSPIESLRFEYPPREFTNIGPVWARGYLAIFLVMTCAASITVKFAFRIT